MFRGIFGLFYFIFVAAITVLLKQTKQAVRTIKQSILLRCLWAAHITKIIQWNYIIIIFNTLWENKSLLKSLNYTTFYPLNTLAYRYFCHSITSLKIYKISSLLGVTMFSYNIWCNLFTLLLLFSMEEKIILCTLSLF